MISSLLLFSTFVILGIPAAIIFIPWSILTGNVLPLYNATQMIVRSGYFLARIRIDVKGRELVPTEHRLHLHGKPRLESRSAGAHSEYSRSHIRLSETIADACTRARLGISTGRIHSRGSGRPQGKRTGEHCRRAASAREGRAHHYVR